MSYIKAETVLPKEILMLVQKYADGQYLYIPKKEENRKGWGENTDSRQQIQSRDTEIYQKYKNGVNSIELAEEYYLSLKSIQRIILKGKNNEL
ncbi:MAG TPA: CD3324 family protein [Mobilitalea sp.]|nr:CD3324 family protein [Mobilitalea sp.]